MPSELLRITLPLSVIPIPSKGGSAMVLASMPFLSIGPMCCARAWLSITRRLSASAPRVDEHAQPTNPQVPVRYTSSKRRAADRGSLVVSTLRMVVVDNFGGLSRPACLVPTQLGFLWCGCYNPRHLKTAAVVRGNPSTRMTRARWRRKRKPDRGECCAPKTGRSKENAVNGKVSKVSSSETRACSGR